jgi:hypothetical protein
MEWFDEYIQGYGIRDYLAEVVGESEDFRETVKSNIGQLPIERALVLQGLSTISLQIEAFMNLLIASMEGQANHADLILEQLGAGRKPGASAMEWFEDYTDGTDDYFSKVSEESSGFTMSVESNLDQSPKEQALVLQGLSTISRQIGPLIDLLAGSMEGQARHNDAIIEQLQRGRRADEDDRGEK